MRIALLGAGHIGQTIARLLHASGDYQVTVVDKNAKFLAVLAAEADVRDREALESAVNATLVRFGRLDAVVAAAGVVAGLGASLALTRLVQGLLFGVTATDPVAFAGVAIVTLVVVLAACCGPALRAVRVSPVRALASE